MIRHDLEILLGKELRLLAIKTRERLELTQREMAERLSMSESSYSDIETGRTKCSTLTAILLLELQDDPKTFLAGMDNEFQKWCLQEVIEA